MTAPSPRSLCRLAPATAAVVLAIASGVAAVRYGSSVAGGADSYGYVSQADLWVQRQLRMHEPLVREVPWPSADWTLSPLGYRPAFERNGDIVPIYPPGLPLTMAVFRVLGGSRAPFLVVPVLGALGICLTYWLGARVSGPSSGLLAAAWLATSPTFLFSLMSPMSDVPAMTWWLLAVVLLTLDGRAAALASGLVAGLGVMTRPNLVPLAVVLTLWTARGLMRERSLAGPSAQRIALFIAGVIPGCVAIGLLFDSWYGSPFQSGYEPLGSVYSWSHARPNALNYSRWWLETLSPLALLAFVAPWSMSRSAAKGRLGQRRARDLAWMSLAFFAVVLGTYVFYLPFDAWWFTRFLLPAYPLLVVSSAAVLATNLDRMRPATRAVVASALCLGLMAWGITSASHRGTFAFGEGELKYPRVARFIAVRLPQRAVILTKQHSGSVRYYAGRLTVRFSLLEPGWLDAAIDYLQIRGRPLYILVEDWEQAEFRARFADHTPIGRLDWPPLAEYRGPSGGTVYVYAPRDRARYLRGDSIVTEPIR